MKIRAIRAALLCLCLTICSCMSRRIPRPEIDGELLPAADNAQILADLSSSDQEIETLRGLTRTTIRHEDGRERLRHVIVFEKPDKLRVEALPLNSAFTLNLVAARDGKVVVLDPGSKRALTGSAGSGLIKDTIGIPVDESELMSYMSGRIPSAVIARDAGQQSVRVYRNDQQNTTAVVVGNYRHFWLYNNDTLDLQTVQIRNPFRDRLLLEICYELYFEVNGVRVPNKIEVWLPEEDVRFTLAFSAISVNKEFPHKLYSVRIPSDYRVYER